ncbi:hypothetical protein GGR53DRAFT_531718 [Hypoxylon sp. FL1150]|nr:hypothetical protein GGR53DRAFT_531718 [Hypoxylon sp. FL1150]
MHCPSVIRCVILATAISLFVLVSLTYRLPFGGILVSSTTTATPCHISLGWQRSSPEKLRYEDCLGTAKTPQVGDINPIGSPRHCLLAGSRLEQYHSTAYNWTEVRWGQVQRRCATHKSRKLPSEDDPYHVWRQRTELHLENLSEGDSNRIAVRLAWLRALIVEVALHRNEKYQVYFLVNIKDTNIDLTDEATYQKSLISVVPEELRDIALLFNERTLKTWYPQTPEHDFMYQALQIFSHKFPQYDYIWQLEMDLRFTGHVHDTLQSATAFTRTQRRRNLWERNGRFYIPHLYNNSYDEFTNAEDTELGDTGVWGPISISDFAPEGPQPPSRLKWNWGVGEEADLISFIPMIDPIGTNWIYEDGIHGFTDGTATPRRAAIVSITRSSRHLLRLVSQAQGRGQWLVSEATLETFALLHGLKAVTVPHPIYFADDVGALDAEINKGPPHSKAGGEAPSMLYMKNGWLNGPWWKASYWFTAGTAGELWEAYVGGQPLPPMLLHPVNEK